VPPQPDRQGWLGTQLAASVRLAWTDNRAVMVSVKGTPRRGYDVRLHRLFRQAPEAVWLALVAYIRGTDATAGTILRAHIRRHQHLIRQPASLRRRAHVIHPQGHHFDLETIYHELNRTYFANRIQARITWSRRPPKRPRTSIRFGSYDVRVRLIRIHPFLDQAFVPRYVVENVIFHEMLHQLIPGRRLNGRWSMHPPEFRQAEQYYPYHRQAEQWKRRNLSRLLDG
jgi:hypothetical protein